MKVRRQFEIATIILICFTLFCGFLIGKYLFPVEKQVLISDRKDACEAKGGKYTYDYINNLGGYYYEQCKIIEKEIERF